MRNDVEENHRDAKTYVTFSIENADSNYTMYLVQDGKEYPTEAHDMGDGVYTYTTVAQLPSGTYAIQDANGTPFGTVIITSKRRYEWGAWSDSDNHTCRACGTAHEVMIGTGALSDIHDEDGTSVATATCEHFTYIVARTIPNDEFSFTWDKFQDGKLTYKTYSVSVTLDDAACTDIPFMLYWEKDGKWKIRMSVYLNTQTVYVQMTEVNGNTSFTGRIEEYHATNGVRKITYGRSERHRAPP